MEDDECGKGAAQDHKQVVVVLGDDAIDERSGQDRQREGKALQEYGNHRDANPHPRPAQHVLDIAPRRFAGSRHRLERLAGLEKEHRAGKRSPQLTHGHFTPSVRGIDDVHAACADTLEDHKVAEVPVENAPGLEEFQILDLHLDAASAQAVVAGGRQNRQRRRAVAPAAERRTQFVDANRLAVKRQDHRQAGGAAFRLRHLTHHRDAARRAGSSEPLQRRKGVDEPGGRERVTSRHGGTTISARG